MQFLDAQIGPGGDDVVGGNSVCSDAGDKRTAQDALAFILGFLERYPVYDGRPFWIAGESYGGRLLGPFLPQLIMLGVSDQRHTQYYDPRKLLSCIEG